MVTQAVQLVGIYLVFASLIIPALAARRFASGKQLLIGYLSGLLGYVLGLAASAYFDLPTGAVVVVALLAVLVGAMIVSPRAMKSA